MLCSAVRAVLCCAALQLEYINGEIWANIWQTECIARICPDSGKVKGWMLMHGLQSNLAQRRLSTNGIDVLNGECGGCKAFEHLSAAHAAGYVCMCVWEGGVRWAWQGGAPDNTWSGAGVRHGGWMLLAGM